MLQCLRTSSSSAKQRRLTIYILHYHQLTRCNCWIVLYLSVQMWKYVPRERNCSRSPFSLKCAEFWRNCFVTFLKVLCVRHQEATGPHGNVVLGWNAIKTPFIDYVIHWQRKYWLYMYINTFMFFIYLKFFYCK